MARRLAFYGEPAWSAKMAPGPLAWDQALHETAGGYQFEIKRLQGEKSFETINKNGLQRGGRPIVQLFPHRIKAASVKITAGADLQPLVTSNFILVPRPGHFDPRRSSTVMFTADRLNSQ